MTMKHGFHFLGGSVGKRLLNDIKKKPKTIKLVLLLGAIMLLGIPHAHALTLSPPTIELEGEPGSVESFTIKLFNETSESVTLVPSYMDFGAKENGTGEPEFFENTQEDLSQLSSWFVPSVSEATVGSGEWQEVSININIPQTAEPGGHYASVFFGSKDINDGSGVGVNTLTGSLVLLNVSGEAVRGGEIESFLPFEGKVSYSHLPVLFEARVKNTGNVHFKPEGVISVTNMFGNVVASIEVIRTPFGGNVLPNSTRRYEIMWNHESVDEKDSSSGFFGLAFSQIKHFSFGPYTARLSVSLPNGERGEDSVTVWIIPWQLMVLILGILVVLIGGVRQYNRWIIGRMQQSLPDKTVSQSAKSDVGTSNKKAKRRLARRKEKEE